MEWYLTVLKKYADFSGRARRKEYWLFNLFNFIIIVALVFVEGLVGGPGVLAMIYILAMLIPGFSVSVRRLHDTDRSGWWILLVLIPLLGEIALLVLMLLDSQEGTNQYGPNPKLTVAAA